MRPVTASRIVTGDCREVLRTLPPASVHCVVTSPPYWGQRDYGVDGMIGLEASVDAWVAAMVEVGREVRRVLRDDGTFWLNLGDKYAGSGGAGGDYNEGGLKDGVAGGPAKSQNIPGLKPKDLMGLPWRVAFALQADGWWLRSDIVWAKPNPMPQSVTDRPSTSHEYVFLLTKSARYFYDADAVREGVSGNAHAQGNGIGRKVAPAGSGILHNDSFSEATRNATRADLPTSRNLRSVWTFPTEPFPGDHYATFPSALPRRCIQAGTSEHGVCADCGAPWARVVEDTGTRVRQHWAPGTQAAVYAPTGHAKKPSKNSVIDSGYSRVMATTGWRPTCDHDAEPVPATVLDPFSGAGTTGLVAAQLGRAYIGIELNPEYVAMSRKRMAQAHGATLDDAPTIGGDVQLRLGA